MRQRWMDRLSLRSKATMAVVLVTLSALLAVAAGGIIQMRALVASEERQTAEAVAQGFGHAAELPLAVRDERELARLAERFMANDQILLIAIYDDAGRPIAHCTRTPAVWTSFLHGAADTGVVFHSQDVMLGAADNEFSAGDDAPAPATAPTTRKAPVGRVVIGLSTAPALAAQRQQAQLTAVFTLLAAAASALLVFLLVHAWARRLNHLVLASERMSRGDFEHAIQTNRQDEIGRLSLAFEQARQAVHLRDSELRRFNSTLQQQVQERTRSLEEALQAARAADQAKSRFLATMSHEIRTPLNGVVGTVDLLRQTTLDENQRRYTHVAKSSAEALLSVINDILDFSKIEAGHMELDAVSFTLQEALEDAARVAALAAARKDIEVNCLVEPQIPARVTGDPGRLRQILSNLLNNAIKFTERGQIVIRAAVAERADGHVLVRFSVSDTGIGIPAERLGRLFHSFSQVDASTTRKYGGTGLGLAISKRLAELMGGTIGVESAEGKGSTFWFTARLAETGPSVDTPRPALRDMRRVRVIAVDDNAINCEILQQQFAAWKLEGLTASSGPHALQLLHDAAQRGAPFDVAILDWHMPDMDGVQLARAIRACHDLRGTALIMLTSIEERVHGADLRNMGFSGYLIKPVCQSQLFDAIAEAFRNPTACAAPHSDPTPAAATPAPRAGAHVLLAEDNEINQMVAAAILVKSGFTCDIVDDGAQAVDAAFTGRFDLVLMDCQMPGMDGFEAARAIRRREADELVPQDARLPIVALTANAIKGDRELCLQAGMDDYVSKPIDHARLCQAIDAAIARSPRRRRARPADATLVDPAPAGQPATHTAPAPAGQCRFPPLGTSSAVAHFLQSAADADAPLVPEPAVAPDAPPLIAAELCARCMNNLELVQRILTKFQDRAESDLAHLARSIADGQLEEAARLAHALKGSAANLSASDVRAVASELETLSRAGDARQAEQALQRLRAAVERCLDYIPRVIVELAPPNSAARP